ncbi:hypothetical protein [Shinella zoogloeoides]|uniref:hypothetical protein n=1 Tax=Shinella zoogloeoides TaxID=352475 RepID=UPI0013C2D648|nr:hypothetical protein [Shinella zoogloeoides]
MTISYLIQMVMGGDEDEDSEVGGRLVVSRCDAAEPFEFGKEALNELRFCRCASRKHEDAFVRPWRSSGNSSAIENGVVEVAPLSLPASMGDLQKPEWNLT